MGSTADSLPEAMCCWVSLQLSILVLCPVPLFSLAHHRAVSFRCSSLVAQTAGEDIAPCLPPAAWMVFAGAIYIRQDYGGAVICTGCSFVNNYARISGGAIHNDGRNVSLDSCTFILNRAGLYGGALAMAGKSMRGSVPRMAALVGHCPEPVTCMAAAFNTSWQPPLVIMQKLVLLIMQVAAVANPQHIAFSVMNHIMPLARNKIPGSNCCKAAL